MAGMTFDKAVFRGKAWHGALFTIAFVLSACASARFQTASVASPAPRGPAFNTPAPLEPAPAAPAGTVTAEPLPPPPGAATTGGIVDLNTMPAPAQPEPLAPAQSPQIASIAPPAAAPAPAATRSNVVGGWNLREATGATCRLTLSSSPALDLYKATATGCANRDLARVTAWDFRDGDVYLYQPGGAVAARLKVSGKAMDGALSKSGAPLTLER